MFKILKNAEEHNTYTHTVSVEMGFSFQSLCICLCALFFRTSGSMSYYCFVIFFLLIYWEVIYLFCISHGSCAWA